MHRETNNILRSRGDPTGAGNATAAKNRFVKYSDLYLPNIFDFGRFSNLFRMDTATKTICTYESMTTDGDMAHLIFKEWTLAEVDEDGERVDGKADVLESDKWNKARGERHKHG